MRKVIAAIMALTLFCMPVQAGKIGDRTQKVDEKAEEQKEPGLFVSKVKADIEDETEAVTDEPETECATEKQTFTVGNVKFSLSSRWELMSSDTRDISASRSFRTGDASIIIIYISSSDKRSYNEDTFLTVMEKSADEMGFNKFVTDEYSEYFETDGCTTLGKYIVYEEDEDEYIDVTEWILTGQGMMEVTYTSPTSLQAPSPLDDYHEMMDNVKVSK